MPPTRRNPRASSLFAPPGTTRMQDPGYLPTRLKTPAQPYNWWGPNSQANLGAPSPYPGTQSAVANTPLGGPYDSYRPGFQFSGYLPTVTKPSPRQTGAGAAWLPWDPNYYAQGPGGQLVGAMVEQAIQNAQAGAGGTGTAGAGGGTTSRRAWKAPPGVDAAWYNQFRQEHGGETPEDYYGRTREGLSEALADREWSQGFQQMYGRPPTDDDWQAWWYSSRGREWAAMSPSERAHARKEARHKGRMEWAREHGWNHWNEYERWVKEGKAQKGQSKQEATPTTPEKAPQYMPPQIVWR